MPKSLAQYGSGELAMRVVTLLDRSKFTTLLQAVNIVRSRFGISPASAYRLAGMAIDVLGLIVVRQGKGRRR